MSLELIYRGELGDPWTHSVQRVLALAGDIVAQGKYMKMSRTKHAEPAPGIKMRNILVEVISLRQVLLLSTNLFIFGQHPCPRCGWATQERLKATSILRQDQVRLEISVCVLAFADPGGQQYVYGRVADVKPTCL